MSLDSSGPTLAVERTPDRIQGTMPSKAEKYRGAVVEDLEPPAALSVSPKDPIHHALLAAFERDYTHLTVLDPRNRALLGYISIPRLQKLMDQGTVTDSDLVEDAMLRFRRKGVAYQKITPDTPLEELEDFFAGGNDGKNPQDFAIVTDSERKFVLGVTTRADLEEFVRRRGCV